LKLFIRAAMTTGHSSVSDYMKEMATLIPFGI